MFSEVSLDIERQMPHVLTCGKFLEANLNLLRLLNEWITRHFYRIISTVP